jgi:hypothetical protein
MQLHLKVEIRVTARSGTSDTHARVLPDDNAKRQHKFHWLKFGSSIFGFAAFKGNWGKEENMKKNIQKQAINTHQAAHNKKCTDLWRGWVTLVWSEVWYDAWRVWGSEKARKSWRIFGRNFSRTLEEFRGISDPSRIDWVLLEPVEMPLGPSKVH